VAAAAAPSNALASLLLIAVKGGLDGSPSMGWERSPFERSLASSLPDKPTGKDAARCNGSDGSSGDDGRTSGAASVSVSPVSPTCVPWSVASLKNDDPTDGDVRLCLCLRRCHTARAMAPIASKAATPPTTPPATMPVCGFDGVPVIVVGLEFVRMTGALRKSE